MTNDELRAALESKLRPGAGYTGQDLTAFALGVEWARRDAAPDEVIELTAALEIRAILEQIKEVAATVHAATLPTPFQAAWQGCCEEIFYRATGKQWHMDEDDASRKVEGPTAGEQIVQRALEAG